MSLPLDVSRCDGETLGRKCERRDTCRRYLERVESDGLAWWIPPQIPGPCIYHLEAPVPPQEGP